MVAHMLRRVILSVWTGVAIIWHAAPVRADAAEVEALIAKGNELRRAGTPGPALPYFQKAYDLARTPRTAGQLGLAELAAGYPVDAEEHLASALQTPDDPSIARFRKMLTDALSIARSQIGELSVRGNPAGAEVIIDGRAVGILPLSAPVKLGAHNVEVVVHTPGYEEHREMVPIVGGQRHALTVSLQKIEKPAEGSTIVSSAPAQPPVPTATPETLAAVVVDQGAGRGDASSGSTSTLRTVAWVAGGGAIVAAGAGVALNLAARANRNDFNSSCVNMNGIHSPGQTLSQADCVHRANAWESDRRWSIAGYVTGAALAVTSGFLFLISNPASPTSDTRAQLRCTPTPTGLACQGLF
jgi:hypothetical protein